MTGTELADVQTVSQTCYDDDADIVIVGVVWLGMGRILFITGLDLQTMTSKRKYNKNIVMWTKLSTIEI